MRLLSAALPEDMDRLQDSVVQSSVQDHGRGAGGAPTGGRRNASTGSSQDSVRGQEISRTEIVSNRSRQKIDFACLKSKCVSPSPGPLLAAPD